MNRRKAMAILGGGALAGPAALKQQGAIGPPSHEYPSLPPSSYGGETGGLSTVDPFWKERQIDELMRRARGQFTDEELERETIKSWVGHQDADIEAWRAVSLSAKRVIASGRQLRRSRESFMRNAVHRLAREFGITLAVACFAVTIAMPAPAKASDCADYGLRTQAYRSCDVFGYCSVRYRCVRAPRVYSYERRRGDDDDDWRGRHNCRDIRKAVGDQHLTVDGAKKAANDAWAGAVRFHLGEKFMDLSNAARIIYTCSRSSIKEAGSSVTTLGQALQRCELAAQPCEAQHQPGEREDR